MKIITGGVGKVEVAEVLKTLIAHDDEVVVGTDMDAAMALRVGSADYYLGTCHTGAGASLGVLVGLLGNDACHTFGRGTPTPQAIEEALAKGVKAMGFSLDQIQEAVPAIWTALKKRK